MGHGGGRFPAGLASVIFLPSDWREAQNFLLTPNHTKNAPLEFPMEQYNTPAKQKSKKAPFHLGAPRRIFFPVGGTPGPPPQGLASGFFLVASTMVCKWTPPGNFKQQSGLFPAGGRPGAAGEAGPEGLMPDVVLRWSGLATSAMRRHRERGVVPPPKWLGVPPERRCIRFPHLPPHCLPTAAWR